MIVGSDKHTALVQSLQSKRSSSCTLVLGWQQVQSGWWVQVMCAVLPALGAAGVALGAMLGKLSTKAADAYGDANSLVQQVHAFTTLS